MYLSPYLLFKNTQQNCHCLRKTLHISSSSFQHVLGIFLCSYVNHLLESYDLYWSFWKLWLKFSVCMSVCYTKFCIFDRYGSCYSTYIYIDYYLIGTVERFKDECGKIGVDKRSWCRSHSRQQKEHVQKYKGSKSPCIQLGNGK